MSDMQQSNLPSDGSPSSKSETTLGLEPNVAAGVAAIFGLPGGLVFFFLEKKSLPVRRWAAKLTVLWGATFALFVGISIFGFIISLIPIIGILFGILMFFVWIVLGFASLGLWIYTIIQGFSGKEINLPIVAEYADKLLAKFPATP